MLFTIALIVLIVLLAKNGRVGPLSWEGPRCGRSNPERTLADRLAAGDLTPDEYLARLDALRRTPAA